MGISGTLNMAGTPEHAEAERAFAIIGEKADKIDAAKLAEFLRALGQTPTQAQVNALPAESDFAAAWSHYEANKKEPIALSAIEDVFKVFDDWMNETQQVHVTSSVDDDSWPAALELPK